MRNAATSTAAAKRHGTRQVGGFAAAVLVPVLTACGLAGSGCAGADPTTALAAAETAKTAVDAARTTAEAIPAAIQAVADTFANASSRNWGRPSQIYVTDDYYVFMYATPQIELRLGRPRMVVVDRVGRIERLQRMENGQL